MQSLREIIKKLHPTRVPAKVGPIGVQFAREELHLVQMHRASSGGVCVHARASIPYPGPMRTVMSSPGQFRTLVHRALRANGFTGRKVISSMAADEVRIISVCYQLNKGETDDQAIVDLMRDRIDGELSDYILDYVPVRTKSKEGQRLALVAMSKRHAVLEHLELLQALGLRIEALEIGPVAIRRLVQAMSSLEQPENVLVVNFGEEKSYLTIVSHRRLLSDQDIDFGENTILKRLSETLEISPDMARDMIFKQGLDPSGASDEVSLALADTGMFNTLLEIVKPELMHLAEEVRRAFMYATSESRGGPAQRVYILGSIARWPGSDRLLDSIIDAPVSKIPDPSAVFHDVGENTGIEDDSADGAAPELAVAAGLALRGMDKDD